MLISKSTEKVVETQPNFRLQLENSEERYDFVIPTINRASAVKAQVAGKKRAATTKGLTVDAAQSSEIVDLIFPKITNLSGKTIFEVFDEYDIDDEVQDAVVNKIISIATGSGTDE